MLKKIFGYILKLRLIGFIRDEIKALRDIRKDIVEIRPLLIEEEALEENRIDNISQLNMVDLLRNSI